MNRSILIVICDFLLLSLLTFSTDINTCCLTIHRFVAAATFPFNQNLSSRHTGGTLSGLYAYIFQLPLRLQ